MRPRSFGYGIPEALYARRHAKKGGGLAENRTSFRIVVVKYVAISR